MNTLSLDALIAYDAMGAADAFSPFGFTGTYPGFSDTELARSNTAFKSVPSGAADTFSTD